MLRRMLGRTSGGASGFRFLHDEISGGVSAYSHLKSSAAYSGSVVSIGTNSTDYGFLDNIVDISQIIADYPANASFYRYYDQLGSNNIEKPTGFLNGWNINNGDTFFKSSQFNGAMNVIPTGGLAAIGSGAFTIMVVFITPSAFTQEYIFETDSNTSFRLYYLNASRFIWRFGTFGGDMIEWDNIPLDFTPSKRQLLCFTYDGSETAGGMKCYQNDMTTEISGGSKNSSGSFSNFAFMTSNLDLGTSKGVVEDLHFFNKVLNQSDREKAKEILEQYYTFS